MAPALRVLLFVAAACLLGQAPALSAPEEQTASILGYGDQVRRAVQGPGYKPPPESTKPPDVMLRKAVERDDLEAAQQAIAAGANPDSRDGNGVTPLIAATIGEHHAIIDLLLDQGADPSLAFGGGHTALHWAAMRGNIGAVERLLEAGAPLDAREEQNGNTPLHYAIRNQGLSVVPLLIAAGADVDTRDHSRNRTPLTSASLRPEAEQAISALLAAGADPNAADKDGWAPIHSAAATGNIVGIELLMLGGADILAEENNGWTAVHLATMEGQAEALEMLIRAGVDPSTRSKWDRDALSLAVEAARLDCLTVLLDYGIDPNTTDRKGTTPIMRAVDEAVDVLSLLIERGGDVNLARHDTGMTALMQAAHGGHVDAIRVLLDAGANTKRKTSKGKTALDLAVEAGRQDAVAVLEKAVRGE